MAQKIIICEGVVGKDLLESHPLAECIAAGYEVTQVSGYSARDNRQMCVVLLSEPAAQTEETPEDTPNTPDVQGSDDNTQGSDETQGETNPNY